MFGGGNNIDVKNKRPMKQKIIWNRKKIVKISLIFKFCYYAMTLVY